MPGLPFGAARQHPVPQEVRDYEHIESIEFIEIDPDVPSPRSVAYRPTAGGAQMRVRDFAPELEDRELSEPEARAYIEHLVATGVFSWARTYRPAQGTFVNVGTEWRLEVEFARPAGAKKKVRPFKAEGENVFPDNFDEVVSALMGSGSAEG